MRVALISIGSRGDAQPFIVLADELASRGHEVVVGLSANLVDLAGGAGHKAMPVGPDILAFLKSDQGRRLLASGNARQVVSRMTQFLHENARVIDDDLRRVCEGADAIVASALCQDGASCVAEASGVPFAAVHLFPGRRTRTIPVPVLATRSLPPALNLASWWFVERMWWRLRRADTNRLRAELGLPSTDLPATPRIVAAGAPTIQAYHRAVVPGLSDYGPQIPVVGFLTPSADLRARLGDRAVDADLRAWLDAGEPPVYFGFGSMPVIDPAATMTMIRTVAKNCGIRAIVSAGWSGFATESSDQRVRVIGAVDHDALLPRCRAAVHHGGAGTTAAGVIAGVPAMVCSVFGDQPFWGSRLHRLEVGTHLRFTDVNARSLESALRPALDPACVARARRLSEQVRSGSAAAGAADHLERHWTTTAGTRR